MNQATYGPWEKLRATAIHLLTAVGAPAGMISLLRLFQNDVTGAFLWLAVALTVDALDGPLARRYRIGEVLPNIDGAILDHVIDYMTYAFIPAIMLQRLGLLPPSLSFPAAVLAVVTSLYSFANRELKTRDNFFSGFPATWNLVVLAFYVLGTPPELNVAVVFLCAVLTFLPVTFLHPFRVRALRPITATLTLLWGVLAVYLVLRRGETSELMPAHPGVYWGFVVVSLYFVVVSVRRSIRGEPDAGSGGDAGATQ